MNYTLKEAADLLGLTKPGVMYHLRMMGGPIPKDERGRVIVPEDALNQIRESVGAAKCKVQTENSAQSDTANLAKTSRKPELTEILQSRIDTMDGEIAKLHEEIAKLNEQLSAKDAQIAEKDKQIARRDEQVGTLTEALATAQRTAEGSQALHAASVKMLQNAMAEDSQAEPEEDPGEEKAPSPQEPPQKKRGLWARLFGRD